MEVKPIMRTRRFFHRYTEKAFLVTVAVLGVLVIGGPANAAPRATLQTTDFIAPAATTTMLTTSPVSPVGQGAVVTLTATVTPATAAGTVQFKDGTGNIGDPVTISNGTASGTTSKLAAGSRSLTAVFIPADAAAFSPSTSPAVTFVVTHSTGKSTNNGSVPPVAASRFALEVDGAIIKHILQVSGLPGQPTGGEVTLTRRLTQDNSFQKWMNDSRRTLSDTHNVRKSGAIVLYDSKGAALRRYKITNALPKTLEIKTMRTGDTSVLTEKLVLTYESMEPE